MPPEDGSTTSQRRTGLPDAVRACLFDLDGVLASTVELHEKAWKETFDAFLRDRDGDGFRPFDHADYARYVDGRPRADGVRTFLRSREIDLPEGDPDDGPDEATVNGVGNRKNKLVLKFIDDGEVHAYPGSVRYLDAVRDAGLAIAVVTSSANGGAVLETTGLDGYVRARIDGIVIRERGLQGKPAPDSFLAGAEALGVAPEHAAVFEDALSGVEAGRAGSFGYVVGVDRGDQADALREHGADVVVDDLADLLDTEAEA